jgi:hypothetical protein
MTKVQDKGALQASGQARPVPMTHKELLLHVAKHFEQKGETMFRMPLELENKSTEELRAMSVEGHMFAEVAVALGSAGIATDGTMASVMDPVGIDKDDAHDFCGCHSPQHDGIIIGGMFRYMADQV